LLTWGLFYFQFKSSAVELFVSYTAGAPSPMLPCAWIC